jgi:hypothetical protein
MTGTVSFRKEATFSYLPRQDSRLVYRLVGFLEYGKSLQFLDAFVKSASEEELKVADEIVRDQDQFVVYTNLSRNLQETSFFNERVEDNVEGSSRQHGLDWNMALARVELGAMLAGFTSHQQPFEVVQPTDYDAEAFQEVLTDGMRTHYWSLKKDPVVKNIYKSGIPEDKLLTYGRHATMALAFLEAVKNLSQSSLTAIPSLPAIQGAELNAMNLAVRKLQLATMYCLYEKLGGSTHLRRRLSNLEGCNGMLAAVVRDLRGREKKMKAGQTLPKFHNPFLLIDPSLIKIPCN